MLKLNLKKNSNNESKLGLLAIGCGFLAIVGPSPIFVPLTIAISIIAFFNGHIFGGSIGFFLASVGFFSSPILIGAVGLAWLWTTADWISIFSPAIELFEFGQDI